jgi:hypothetical protein
MPRYRLLAAVQPPGAFVSGQPSHLIDTDSGIEVPIAGATKLLLHISNDGPSVATLTIRGGKRALSPHGNGEDERVQIASGESRFVGPIDPAAFMQEGGVVWLDFTHQTVGRIEAFALNKPHHD